jgi:hypothetical protein
MAEIQGQTEHAEKQSHRKILIGTVVSNKMQKTIVVEVTRKKAHPMYKRVISIRQEVLRPRREERNAPRRRGEDRGVAAACRS